MLSVASFVFSVVCIIFSNLSSPSLKVTAIEFDEEGGFQMAVGSSEGKVRCGALTS